MFALASTLAFARLSGQRIATRRAGGGNFIYIATVDDDDDDAENSFERNCVLPGFE